MSYTQFPLGIDKAATPYNVGTLLNGTWRDFATLSSLGAFIINSTSGGAGTVSGVMAANGGGVVTGVSGTSGHTVPWLDGVNTWDAQQTFSAAPILSSFAEGSVPFIGAGGVLSQSNADLFWDNTNKHLGIGLATPQAQIQIKDINLVGTTTTFQGVPSSGNFGIGSSGFSLWLRRTGGVGSYGHNFSYMEVTADSGNPPEGRISDHLLTAWLNANNNLTGGRINGFWLGANSPATANGHTYTSGQVTAGEINYGNRTGDLGILTTLTLAPATTGLLIAPDPVPNTEPLPYESTTVTVGTPAVFTRTAHGYFAGMAVKFFGAGATAAGLTEGAIYYVISTDLLADTYKVSTTREGAALNLAGTSGALSALPSYPGVFGLIMAGTVSGHQVGTQIHIQQNSVRPGGYGIYAKGSTSVSSLMAPAGMLTGFDTWSRGIDFQFATFVNDAIRIADGHRFRLGLAQIWGASSGSLNITTGGTTTIGRLLGNGAAQEVLTWGSNGTPEAVLSFYGAAPVVRQDITGAKGGNAALADLLTKLALMGLITDSTT